MHDNKVSRRHFLRQFALGTLSCGTYLSATSSLASLTIDSAQQASPHHHPSYASAATDTQNNHWVVTLSNEGRLLHKHALPSRAHQITYRPYASELAIAARRPGRYLIIIDYLSGILQHTLTPSAGHHFYGHSVYSADGCFLYTTENHIDSGEGRVFVRDAHDNYRVVRFFSSHGIGPHEIKLHPDKKTLVIANGGILTHPESGRTKLNLDTMSPSLVYLSAETGTLIDQQQLPHSLHQLSIRHIDINKTGLVAIAMQYQGSKVDDVALIATHQIGYPIKTLRAPDMINHQMKHYCGSVCFNNSGTVFAVTSPKGSLITLWGAQSTEFIKAIPCSDVCGIGPKDEHGFTFSNGYGKLYELVGEMKLEDQGGREIHLKRLEKAPANVALAWDNHLTSIM